MTFLTSASGRSALLGELRQAAVVIQAGHRREAVRRQRGRIALRDQRIGVGWIAHHQHAHVAAATASSALPWAENILAFSNSRSLRSMPGTARPGADQHGEIAVLEADVGIGRGRHLVQSREGAVVQLHHHALHRRARRRDLQQIQIDRLIGAEHLTRCDAKRQRITDIAGGARDGDSDWLLHD